MRAIWCAARDELRAVFTDGQVRSILLLSLVIYAVIYTLPYRAELLRDVPVVLVDQDRTTTSADLVRRIEAPRVCRRPISPFYATISTVFRFA